MGCVYLGVARSERPGNERGNGFAMPRLPEHEPSPRNFALRCADVHPVNCDVTWHSSDPEELILDASEHGAAAHGFTPAWYSPARVAAIAAAVIRS